MLRGLRRLQGRWVDALYCCSWAARSDSAQYPSATASAPRTHEMSATSTTTASTLRAAPEGEAITMNAGRLEVPTTPVVPFIEGDGTGPDIWRASQLVFDGAVERAY